jgi:hypothetical protein
MIRLLPPAKRKGPVDAHGTPLRTLEFVPDATARRDFVTCVLAILGRRGLVGRAAWLGRRRVRLHVRHPAGVERSVTIDVASSAWGYSLAGAPVTPTDIAEALMRPGKGRRP